MLAVVAAVLIAAAHFIVAHAASSDAAFFTRPFYDPSTFSFHALFSCTAITILTYIGFDGISTLSEECENPRRNMLLAPVLTCVIIGILSAVEVYVAQLAWPASQPFPDVDTAYAWVAGRMWGPLFSVVGVTLIVAILASGMAAHLGAARLLYGMGRSNALPRRFFGAVEPTHGIPRNNVILVGVIILVGAFVLTFEQTVELLNFGALTAFMGVNAAAFVRYFLRAPTKTALNCVSPVLGFAVCLFLWWNLGLLTKAVGLAWMAVGLLCGALMTGGFRNRLKLEFPDD
jgi:amino acid transporter